MSPPTIAPSVHAPSHYISSPVDAIDRHEYGVQKNRKPASTGGGRAWSEDEEVYLLQTRLQKMPYKHIAAHLKKTELACRLHYHQLSHGSNRRKQRSASDASSHHPVLFSRNSPSQNSGSASPPSTSHGYTPRPFSPDQTHSTMPHLPALHHQHGAESIRSASSSPNPLLQQQRTLPAILPKPLPPRAMAPAGTPPLRLDCALPPLNTTFPLAHSPLTTHNNGTATSTSLPALNAPVTTSANNNNIGAVAAAAGAIDLQRLASIYASHRAGFWAGIASAYGPTAVSAAQMEDAYFRYVSGGGSSSSASVGSFASTAGNMSAASSSSLVSATSSRSSSSSAGMAPPTPCISPAEDGRAGYESLKGVKEGAGSDKTSISALLGIDANPRSPRERELIRRLEEGGVVRPSSGVAVVV